MSFRYFVLGPVMESRVHNGNIEVRNPNLTVSSFQSEIREEIPWKRCLFNSPYAMFAYEHEGLVYVGRRDGSWSAHTDSGLIVKLGNWKPPKLAELIEVGCYTDTKVGPRVAYLDSSDMKTVYIKGTDMVYVLNEPMTYEPIIPVAISSVITYSQGLFISRLRGMLNELEEGTWFIPSNIKWGNNTVPLSSRGG